MKNQQLLVLNSGQFVGGLQLKRGLYIKAEWHESNCFVEPFVRHFEVFLILQPTSSERHEGQGRKLEIHRSRQPSLSRVVIFHFFLSPFVKLSPTHPPVLPWFFLLGIFFYSGSFLIGKVSRNFSSVFDVVEGNSKQFYYCSDYI